MLLNFLNKEGSLLNIYILPNLKKDNSEKYVRKAAGILKCNSTELSMSEKYSSDFSDVDFITFSKEDELASKCDIILAVGGDGTILKASAIACKYNKPILGLNCGRLGFMCTLEHNELNLLNNLCNGDYVIQKRIMLDGKIIKTDGGIKTFTALNDIVVSKPFHSKISDFEVSKSGKIVSSIRADGLIFSTPTGATAYSLSAGGPIIEPDMECIEFTPICPHSLLSRTMIFSKSSKLTVKFFTNSDECFGLSVDGVTKDDISSQDILTISASEKYIKLIDIKGGSFFDSVNSKLMRPLKAVMEDSDNV